MADEYGFVINVAGDVVTNMELFEGSVKKFGATAKTESKEVGESFSLMGEKMSETFKNLKGLLLTGLGITALFEGWEFIEKSKEAFEGLEKAVTRVDTVLKSTKFAAGFTSEDIQDQAKELSKGIVNKRDEILDAQGMLLSFHDIRGPKFTETMKSVADFATFYKEDMTAAAMQVGKAINDPLKGMTRLQRMGVEFSAEQKEQIKNYVQQGDLAKAQEVILRELRTEFGGQAQAFALTDAGKIQVAAKQWEELQFAIGEIISKVEVSLIPSFTKVVQAIKGAFNSGVVQFFIEHLKDLVAIVLKLVPIWIGYKLVMMAVAGITQAYEVIQLALASAMGTTIATTEAETVAMEGLSSAIASTGIGALVVGLGLLIEKFISWNSEIDKTVDKLSNIKEISETFDKANEQFDKTKLTWENIGNLSGSQQSEFLSDLNTKIKSTQDKLATELIPQLDKTKNEIANYDKATGAAISNFNNQSSKGFGGDYVSVSKANNTRQGLVESLKKNQDAVEGMTKQLKEYQFMQRSLASKGIKSLNYTNPGDAMKDNAFNTSNLSGAKGGLNEAKVINISIGTLQKNEGVHESKDKAQDAVELLIRTLNNMAYSQSGTFGIMFCYFMARLIFKF